MTTIQAIEDKVNAANNTNIELIGVWDDGNGTNEVVIDDGSINFNRGNVRVCFHAGQELSDAKLNKIATQLVPLVDSCV